MGLQIADGLSIDWTCCYGSMMPDLFQQAHLCCYHYVPDSQGFYITMYQHNRTASAGQTKGTQSLVANHSAAGPDSAERATSADEGEEEASRENEMRTVPSQVTQTGSQCKHPERRTKIKWPKASMQEVWCRLDEHLSGVLQHSLQGTVEHKLTLMGNIIYEECRERFGECTSKQTIAPRQKGQRKDKFSCSYLTVIT